MKELDAREGLIHKVITESTMQAQDEIQAESKEDAAYRRLLRAHERSLLDEYDDRWYRSWWAEKSFAWRLVNSDKAPGTPGANEQIRALVAAQLSTFETAARFFARAAAKPRGDGSTDLIGSEAGVSLVTEEIVEAQRAAATSFLDRAKEIAREK
jgi:hypothetical protein